MTPTDAEIAEILEMAHDPLVHDLASALQESRARLNIADQELDIETAAHNKAKEQRDRAEAERDSALDSLTKAKAYLIPRSDRLEKAEAAGAELIGRIDELEADARRLNWLDHHYPGDQSTVNHEVGAIAWFQWGPARLVEVMPFGLRWTKITAREAIDAALAESEPPLCPDSPDGKHHCAPIGSEEDYTMETRECYYCGEKATRLVGA